MNITDFYLGGGDFLCWHLPRLGRLQERPTLHNPNEAFKGHDPKCALATRLNSISASAVPWTAILATTAMVVAMDLLGPR